MPIGCTRPMAWWRARSAPTAIADPRECGRPTPALSRCRSRRAAVAYRAVALVELRRDALEAGDRPFNLVGDFGHFASIGVNGEAAPSSLAWFTPSARAI